MLVQEFEIKPSWSYKIYLAFMLSFSVIVIVSLQYSWWLKILALIMLIGYGIYLSYLNTRLVKLAFKDETWIVTTRHKTYRARLLGDSVITAYVAVLRFKVDKQFFAINCFLFKDAFVGDNYRRFRVLCFSTSLNDQPPAASHDHPTPQT